jgi:hypothetical protein
MKMNKFARYQLIVMLEHARKQQDVADGAQDLQSYVEFKKNYRSVVFSLRKQQAFVCFKTHTHKCMHTRTHIHARAHMHAQIEFVPMEMKGG